MEPICTTSDAAKILDRSAQMVRIYEKTGKLPAMRTRNGVRVFLECDVLKFAGEMKELENAKAVGLRNATGSQENTEAEAQKQVS